MTAAELGYLGKEPTLVPVYAALRDSILKMYPKSEIRVQKTTLSFRHPMPYCYVGLPISRISKDAPKKHLVVSLLLGEHIVHPRFPQVTEAYPGRFTHHLVLSSAEEVDDELLAWVRQSHDFRYLLTGGKARN